jgi:hypothetical protein
MKRGESQREMATNLLKMGEIEQGAGVRLNCRRKAGWTEWTTLARGQRASVRSLMDQHRPSGDLRSEKKGSVRRPLERGLQQLAGHRSGASSLETQTVLKTAAKRARQPA